MLIVKSPLAAGDHQHWRCPCHPCRCRCDSCLCLRFRIPPEGCRGTHRRTSCWRNGAGNGIRVTGNGLLHAPQTTLSRKSGRAEEGRTTSTCQGQQLRQRPPRPLALSATTIVVLEPPPSSSIIAVAILLSGCNATMCTLVEKEDGTPALAPASPIKIKPGSAAAGGGGTSSLLRLLRGGAEDPPSSSFRQPKNPTVVAAAAVPAW